MSIEANNLQGHYEPSPSDRVREQVALDEAPRSSETSPPTRWFSFRTARTSNGCGPVSYYEHPYPAVTAITSRVAFYPDRVEIVIDDHIAP
jgi:hypothetical protein